jgi:hypothetical protein
MLFCFLFNLLKVLLESQEKTFGENSESGSSILLCHVRLYFLRHVRLFAAKIPSSDSSNFQLKKCSQQNVILRDCVTEIGGGRRSILNARTNSNPEHSRKEAQMTQK